MPAPTSAPAPHIQVPQLLQDMVLPLLSHAEVMCLMYIVRRTRGFTRQGGGGQKTHDRISLSQFEHGISSGEYVLDLGTGLRSRSTIVSALRSLEEKGLVAVSPVCDRCRWGSDPDEPQSADPGLLVTGARCPRCRRTLSKVYGLAPLTPRTMTAFLNANDPRGRSWTFDHSVRRFLPQTEAVAEPVPAPATDDYRAMLWYPDLVDQAMTQFTEARGRALTEDEMIRHFYEPVIALQEMSAQFPAMLKRALTETLRKRIPASVQEVRQANDRVSRRFNTGWHRYTKAIVRRELARPAFTRRSETSEPASAPPSTESIMAREQGVQELLERARELNRAGNAGAARAVLSEVLAQVPHLAPLFGGSERLADAHLRLAFKHGLRDFQSAREAVALHDHYPEWEWPEDLEGVAAA